MGVPEKGQREEAFGRLHSFENDWQCVAKKAKACWESSPRPGCCTEQTTDSEGGGLEAQRPGGERYLFTISRLFSFLECPERMQWPSTLLAWKIKITDSQTWVLSPAASEVLKFFSNNFQAFFPGENDLGTQGGTQAFIVCNAPRWFWCTAGLGNHCGTWLLCWQM